MAGGYRWHNSKKTKDARALGYRSGLEVSVANGLKARGVPFEYETVRVPYMLTKTQHYKPDIVLPNGIIVEVKGQFKTADRTRHLMIRAQHPELEIRFVFSRSASLIGKKSKTTYAKWCQSHAFVFADKTIPQAWIDEVPNGPSLRALEKLK